jgi:hypothetical protein
MEKTMTELQRFTEEFALHWRANYNARFDFTGDNGERWDPRTVKDTMDKLHHTARLDRAVALMLPDVLGIYLGSGGVYLKHMLGGKEDVQPSDSADEVIALELLLPPLMRIYYLINLQKHLPDSSLWSVRTAPASCCVMAMLETRGRWPFKTWEEPDWLFEACNVVECLQATNTTFDTALPQEFYDMVYDTLRDHPWCHFVWAYPAGVLCGCPCPKTHKAKAWLEGKNIPYYDVRNREICKST